MSLIKVAQLFNNNYQRIGFGISYGSGTMINVLGTVVVPIYSKIAFCNSIIINRQKITGEGRRKSNI
jgi:hypothetical protein